MYIERERDMYLYWHVYPSSGASAVLSGDETDVRHLPADLPGRGAAREDLELSETIKDKL